MRRPSTAAALLVALSVTATAGASGKHKHAPAPTASAVAPTVDPHAALADQLAAESEALARALGTVVDKLATADAHRAHRLRAATELLHAPLLPDATDDDRLAYARRRAAVRLLLERDAAERNLLAAEADHLRAATTRVTTETALLPTIHLPASLAWPAHGKIARKFGPFEHERSHATLSRRGIDLEVDDRAAAVAPDDGVVRYAGPIRGLDRGVILDHGDYVTVIAKLGELAPPVGTHVARGDRLGRALRHRVYLEVRVKVGPGGLPIDPEPLLAPPR